jgi:hypothetical protein
MNDPKPKLTAPLDNTQEYLELAISAQGSRRARVYQRVAELYFKIAKEAGAMMGGTARGRGAILKIEAS